MRLVRTMRVHDISSIRSIVEASALGLCNDVYTSEQLDAVLLQ